MIKDVEKCRLFVKILPIFSVVALVAFCFIKGFTFSNIRGVEGVMKASIFDLIFQKDFATSMSGGGINHIKLWGQSMADFYSLTAGYSFFFCIMISIAMTANFIMGRVNRYYLPVLKTSYFVFFTVTVVVPLFALVGRSMPYFSVNIFMLFGFSIDFIFFYVEILINKIDKYAVQRFLLKYKSEDNEATSKFRKDFAELFLTSPSLNMPMLIKIIKSIDEKSKDELKSN